MADYNIVSVDYSLKTEIEDSSAMEFTNKIGVPHKEVTYLMGHATFTYKLGNEVVEGECIYPVAKVCTVIYTEVDNQIKATSFVKNDNQPTQEALDALVEAAVEAEYTSSIITQVAEQINLLYTNILNAKLAFNDSYSPAPTSYEDELKYWHTGIGRGAYEINDRFPSADYDWEDPVLDNHVLSITQAYFIKLKRQYNQLNIE